jgi:hypothetical protein
LTYVAGLLKQLELPVNRTLDAAYGDEHAAGPGMAEL